MNKNLEKISEVLDRIEKINAYFDHQVDCNVEISVKKNFHRDGFNWSVSPTMSYKGERDKLKLFKSMVVDAFDDLMILDSYNCGRRFSFSSSEHRDIPDKVDVIEFKTAFVL